MSPCVRVPAYNSRKSRIRRIGLLFTYPWFPGMEIFDPKAMPADLSIPRRRHSRQRHDPTWARASAAKRADDSRSPGLCAGPGKRAPDAARTCPRAAREPGGATSWVLRGSGTRCSRPEAALSLGSVRSRERRSPDLARNRGRGPPTRPGPALLRTEKPREPAPDLCTGTGRGRSDPARAFPIGNGEAAGADFPTLPRERGKEAPTRLGPAPGPPEKPRGATS